MKIFLTTPLYMPMAKSFIHAQDYVALAKLYVALADSPLDLW